MSIRGKLSNWLSGGELEALKIEISSYKNMLWDSDSNGRKLSDEVYELRTALKRIYDTPCGPKSNGTQRKIRRIAAHALWKE